MTNVSTVSSDPDHEIWDDDMPHFVRETWAADRALHPLLRECIEPIYGVDENGDAFFSRGCGWWRPAENEELASGLTCPGCGGITSTRKLLSLQEAIKARAFALGVSQQLLWEQVGSPIN